MKELIFGILILIAIMSVMVVLIVLLRTVLVRSTPAKDLELLLENDARAQEYGEKLAKMMYGRNGNDDVQRLYKRSCL